MKAQWRWVIATVVLVACGGGGGPEDAGSRDAARDSSPVDTGPATCASNAECDDGLFCNGAEACAPDDLRADADGCAPAEPECLAGQTCDESMDRCLTMCDISGDADGDGHDSIDCSGDDCDDSDPNRFPGNAEVCDVDDHDEDCDPATFGDRDTDSDTYFDASCCNTDSAGAQICGDDCADHDPNVHPTAPEVCNGIDDNCDGVLSELEDVDRDGFAKVDCAGTDCDDSDPTIYPGAPELCDGEDNNCSLPGFDAAHPRDPTEDIDDDMHAPLTATCMGGPFPKDDCDDADATVSGGLAEVCDGLDNDCDGTTDEEPEASAACAASFSSSVACMAGACTEAAACPTSFNDCDGVPGATPTASCESDSRTDTLNCGGCGSACLMSCLSSSCDEVVDVDAGREFTCALLASGRVSCWGDNTHGGLGDGTTTGVSRPVRVRGVTSAVQISAGILHVCATLASGSVMCWGWNRSGQLGDGTRMDRPVPTAVAGLTDAVQVAAGRDHTCARRRSGQVVCWGSNGLGQLGDGTNTDRLTPGDVNGLGDAVTIAAGYDHSCAIRGSGQVVCWGAGSLGGLGHGASTSSNVPVNTTGLADATALSLNKGRGCAIRASGQVVCWGKNWKGEVGDGTTDNRLAPVNAAGVTDAVQLAAGFGHTCARETSGQIVCWGDNSDGQLGDAMAGAGLAPVDVVGITSALRLASGDSHSCAQTGSGPTAQLLCWGLATSGQLGEGTLGSGVRLRSTPTPVLPLP